MPKKSFTFRDAESARHATKFWNDAQAFTSLTGTEAVKETKRFMLRSTGERIDETYAGFGSEWAAMKAILRVKFCAGSDMSDKLMLTGDDYLLNVGRDKTWANHDGTGKNHLGLLLMVVRDDILRRSQMNESWTSCFIDHETGRPDANSASSWQVAVSHASDALRKAVNAHLSHTKKLPSAFEEAESPPPLSMNNMLTDRSEPGLSIGRHSRFHTFAVARQDIKDIVDTSLSLRPSSSTECEI
jgi:predicted NAD-dependent protein-ADP-ribosyltransferase YbiA (DUF1768 family)